MRILFVTPSLPVPTSGGHTRLYNLARSLSTRHEVTILSLVKPFEYDLLAGTEPCCSRLELVPFEGFRPVGKWRNRLQGWLRLLLNSRPRYADTFPVEQMRRPLRGLLAEQSYDVVLFHQLFVAELVDEVQGVPAILAEDNVESDIARRTYRLAANPVHKVRDWLIWRRLLQFEQACLKRFSLCVAVSERDGCMLRAMSPAIQVCVVPNGVDMQHFAPTRAERDPYSVLFFGTLSYAPNTDGLVWFCKEVLPRIRRSCSEATLEIVGLYMPSRVRDLAKLPGVRVTGFVPDIREKLWKASACVVPLHIGGGTRLKILESLAAGCPVVSTSVGAEGLSLVPGEHLLVADTPEGFAHDVLQLLGSPALQQRLARAGWQAVAQQYDWSVLATLLESACLHAVQRSRRAGREG